jgi:hypothetical protein
LDEQIFAISWIFCLQIVLCSNLLPHHLFRYVTIVKSTNIRRKALKFAVISYGLNLIFVLTTTFICLKYAFERVNVLIFWLLCYLTSIILTTFLIGISTIRQLYSECLTTKTKQLRRRLICVLLVQAS